MLKLLGLLCCLAIPVAAQGQAIYKTVDEDGNISYSSVKPEEQTGAEVITAPPEPTEEETQAAIQRQAELKATRQAQREERETERKERQEAREQARKTRSSQTVEVIPFPILRTPPPVAVPF